MLEKIKTWDEELFLFLNAQHVDWLDPIMMLMTGRPIWLPLYAFLLYLIINHFRMKSIWILAGIGLTIWVADQTASGLMKPFFERLRPCHDPRWDELMYNPRRCGSLYGFVSSHASNTFGLATYMTLVFQGRLKGIAWLFLWAAIVSYTRIYVGVHYPLDLLIGALVGVAAALIFFFVLKKLKLLSPADMEESI